jgi:hypothetical protein
MSGSLSRVVSREGTVSPGGGFSLYRTVSPTGAGSSRSTGEVSPNETVLPKGTVFRG